MNIQTELENLLQEIKEAEQKENYAEIGKFAWMIIAKTESNEDLLAFRCQGFWYAAEAEYRSGRANLALKPATEALNIARKIPSALDEAKSLTSLGLSHWRLSDYPAALQNMEEALAICRTIHNRAGIANNYDGLAHIYFNLKDYSTAYEFFQKELAINYETGSKYSIALTKKNLGAIHSNPDFAYYNLEKAEMYCLEALAEFELLGTKNELSNVHKDLANVYEQQGNWEKAHIHFKQFHELTKEVQSEEIQKQAQRFALELDVAMMQKEQEVLRIKNEELAVLNNKLAEKNQELTVVNQEKNEFLGITAHDLKNPLNSILLAATVLEENAPIMEAEEIKEYSGDIRTSSKQMLDLILNLLDVNKIEQGITLTGMEKFSVSERVFIIAERFRHAAERKQIEFAERYSEVYAETSPSVFMQVIENLISNAVKYSPHGKNIFVTVEKLG